jgi:hypothetical protein
MTKDQLDAVLDRIHSWPQERQEDAVRLLLALEAQDGAVYQLTPEEREDLDAALDEVASGDVASDAEVAALFGRI